MPKFETKLQESKNLKTPQILQLQHRKHKKSRESLKILKNHEAFRDGVNISTEVKRHLGAVIGSFTFCMRTIESFEDFVNPVKEVIQKVFIPTLFGQEEPLSDSLQTVVTLTPNQSGLGIPCLKEDSPQQFAASKFITSRHPDQNLTPLEELMRQYLKANMTKSKIERIDGRTSKNLNLTEPSRTFLNLETTRYNSVHTLGIRPCI